MHILHAHVVYDANLDALYYGERVVPQGRRPVHWLLHHMLIWMAVVVVADQSPMEDEPTSLHVILCQTLQMVLIDRWSTEALRRGPQLRQKPVVSSRRIAWTSRCLFSNPSTHDAAWALAACRTLVACLAMAFQVAVCYLVLAYPQSVYPGCRAACPPTKFLLALHLPQGTVSRSQVPAGLLPSQQAVSVYQEQLPLKSGERRSDYLMQSWGARLLDQ